MAENTPLPKYDDLFHVTLQVIATSGCSASMEELDDAILEAIGAPQEQLDVVYRRAERRSCQTDCPARGAG